jgi:mRNA-degrading endonuclease toxin of MazEF toxin-antitoxin module
MPKPTVPRSHLVKSSVFEYGQVYVIAEDDVARSVGRNIGDRWAVIIQSTRLNRARNQVIVAQLTGAENPKKGYPWNILISRADAPFLDKDTIALCASIMTLSKDIFYEQYMMGRFNQEICAKISAGLTRALQISEV